MSGPFGGSQFQLPNVQNYLPSGSQVQGALGTSATGANQLWNIGQPPKKGQPWNQLALQSQLPSYTGAINTASNQINAFAPSAMGAATQGMNLGLTAADMAGGAIPGLYGIGGLMTGAVPGMMTTGQGLLSSELQQAPGLMGYADQALATGFDPLQAQQNRYLQQMHDITGASVNAAGLGSSPVGANLQTQGMENALLDWQMGAAQRQQMGASTAGSLFNTVSGLPTAGESLYNLAQGMGTTGANIDTSALGLGQGAAQLAQGAGMLPIETSGQIAQSQIGLQDALTQAKTNMFNQRSSGLNAENQYLNTASNVLKDALSGMGVNLAAADLGLGTDFGFASIATKLLGK